MSIARRVVYDTATLRVKRWGYTEFETQSDFDPATETVIESSFTFNPPVDGNGDDTGVPWYSDGAGSFTTTPPGD